MLVLNSKIIYLKLNLILVCRKPTVQNKTTISTSWMIFRQILKLFPKILIHKNLYNYYIPFTFPTTDININININYYKYKIVKQIYQTYHNLYHLANLKILSWSMSLNIKPNLIFYLFCYVMLCYICMYDIYISWSLFIYNINKQNFIELKYIHTYSYSSTNIVII